MSCSLAITKHPPAPPPPPTHSAACAPRPALPCSALRPPAPQVPAAGAPGGPGSPGPDPAAVASAHVSEAVAEVEGWFNRLDCLVVGPGLGRDPLLLDIARAVILRARAAKMPLVLDGDGLFLVAREPELVAGGPGWGGVLGWRNLGQGGSRGGGGTCRLPCGSSPRGASCHAWPAPVHAWRLTTARRCRWACTGRSATRPSLAVPPSSPPPCPRSPPGYTNCVLTPNLNEFRRLASTLGVSLHGPNNDRSSKLLEVTAHLRGPTLVSKGPVDAICDGKVTMICNASGGGSTGAGGGGPGPGGGGGGGAGRHGPGGLVWPL